MAILHHWRLILWVLAAWCAISVALIPLVGFIARRIR
jgi:hypothetical protein